MLLLGQVIFLRLLPLQLQLMQPILSQLQLLLLVLVGKLGCVLIDGTQTRCAAMLYVLGQAWLGQCTSGDVLLNVGR